MAAADPRHHAAWVRGLREREQREWRPLHLARAERGQSAQGAPRPRRELQRRHSAAGGASRVAVKTRARDTPLTATWRTTAMRNRRHPDLRRRTSDRSIFARCTNQLNPWQAPLMFARSLHPACRFCRASVTRCLIRYARQGDECGLLQQTHLRLVLASRANQINECPHGDCHAHNDRQRFPHYPVHLIQLISWWVPSGLPNSRMLDFTRRGRRCCDGRHTR